MTKEEAGVKKTEMITDAVTTACICSVVIALAMLAKAVVKSD